jgi:hypothetical protein
MPPISFRSVAGFPPLGDFFRTHLVMMACDDGDTTGD